MAKPKDLPRVTPKKKKAKPSGDNSDVLELFEEAKQKAAERDGMRIELGKKTFDFWPSQVDYRQRQKLWQHTGMTPNDAAMMLGSGQGSLEAIAAVIAMAMFQMYDGVLPDMDGVSAWVEQSLFDTENTENMMEVTQLKFEDHDEDPAPED